MKYIFMALVGKKTLQAFTQLWVYSLRANTKENAFTVAGSELIFMERKRFRPIASFALDRCEYSLAFILDDLYLANLLQIQNSHVNVELT